ncbi:protein FAM246C-like [Cavia porcellus]|uniref:protein FAM246C-like n=1 Tax=Cavia porcellus TaxID=10141 RepID=UPI002FE3E690
MERGVCGCGGVHSSSKRRIEVQKRGSQQQGKRDAKQQEGAPKSQFRQRWRLRQQQLEGSGCSDSVCAASMGIRAKEMEVQGAGAGHLGACKDGNRGVQGCGSGRKDRERAAKRGSGRRDGIRATSTGDSGRRNGVCAEAGLGSGGTRRPPGRFCGRSRPSPRPAGPRGLQTARRNQEAIRAGLTGAQANPKRRPSLGCKAAAAPTAPDNRRRPPPRSPPPPPRRSPRAGGGACLAAAPKPTSTVTQ